MKKELTRLFSVLLAAVLVFGTLPVSAMGTDVADPPASAVDDTAVDESVAEPEEQSAEVENVALQAANDASYDYNIFFLDCGRKYYSVDSIKQLIDNASAAGFNYIQLAVGNDGLRFLLDDMSLTVNGKDYGSDDVKAAIQNGNQSYNDWYNQSKAVVTDGHEKYNPDTNELTQTEMNTIISYANSKGMGVIPCVNTPGHMDAILAAATSLTGTDCAYNGSVRTIDVTNTTAVAFTQALLQKYINYFAGKGCQLFNMGADEYANDIYSTGGMGFGQLQNKNQYGSYVTYINTLAGMIKAANMKPMAFNDGIYYNNNTSSGTFDPAIIVCYWSNGWSGYSPLTASNLKSKKFQLINTNGSYYWVVGNAKDQCSAEKAAGFDTTVYPKYSNGWTTETVEGAVGSMFCIWADFPGDEDENTVVKNTADTIAAFGSTLPDLKEKLTVSVGDSTEAIAATKLGVGGEQTLTASKSVEWTVEDENVVSLTPVSDVATYSASVTAKAVTAKAEGVGETTITVTDPNDPTVTASVNVSVQEMTEETITIAAGQEKTITVSGQVTPETVANPATASVTATHKTGTSTKVNETPVTSIESGKQYVIKNQRAAKFLTSTVNSQYSWGQNTITVLNLDDSAAVWSFNGTGGTVFTGTVSSNDQYLTIGSNTANVTSSRSNTLRFEYLDGSWRISQTSGNASYYLNDWAGNSNAAAGYANNSSNAARNDEGSKWEIYEVTTEQTYETDLTFKGLEEGETTVVIGSVKYTIKVLSAELAKAEPLKLEYWITNSQPSDSKGNTFLAISATDNDVTTDNGVSVADVLPQEVSLNGRKQVYWRSTMLDVEKVNTSSNKTELQCTQNGDDETWSGDLFTRVRYNSTENQWEVYTTDEKWVKVDRTQVEESYVDSNKKTQYYKDSKNQLVAYYMEQMDIANNKSGDTELKINAADWGVKGDTSGNWGYTPESSRCSISVQIVYEDGTNPAGTDADSLKAKTFVYSLESSRGIGTMIFNAQQNYEITKISATTGTMTSETKDTYYINVTGLTWNSDETTVWSSSGADAAKSATIYNSNGEPDTTNKQNLTWVSGTNNAILIRVYMKTVANKDSLHVHYVDESNGGSFEFYEYPINVIEGTTFDPNFGLTDGVLHNNTVTTDAGASRSVSTDLTNLTEIGAQYRYTEYKCVRAERSEDGKDVYLYYTFSNTVGFVVDFGTPITFAPADINASLANNNVSINRVEIEEGSITHGTVEYGQNGSFTYKPNSKFVSSRSGETLQVTYYGTVPVKDEDGNETVQQGHVSYTVYIYPASNVLYEENFLSKDTSQEWATEKQKWTDPTVAKNEAQQSQKVNSTGTYNVFGYDGTYASSTGENGVWKADALEPDKLYQPLTTSFYGNTFDLIGDCDKDTGRVLMIFKDTNGGYAKVVDVDTRYSEGKLTQVPLAHVTLGETDANYTVLIYASGLNQKTIAATPNGVATMAMQNDDGETDELLAQVLEDNGLTLDEVEYVSTSVENADASDVAPKGAVATYAAGEIVHEKGTHVEIDGFRVYRSTTDDVAVNNYPAAEQNVTYKNILDVVGSTITAYVEGGNVEDYDVKKYEEAGGPQNEIYLDKDQSVVIQLSDNTPIQVSLRAVNGATQWNTNTASEGTQISANTEMYYTVTPNDDGTVAIVNKGDNLLAIGNVKFKSQVTVTSSDELSSDVIIAALNAAYGNTREPDPDPDPEPDPEPETFQPTTFTVNDNVTKVIRNKVVTLKIKVSDDVAYVTVNGVKYTRSGLQSSFQKTRTIRVMNTIPRNAEKTYEIIAYNADGVASEAVTKTVK